MLRIDNSRQRPIRAVFHICMAVLGRFVNDIQNNDLFSPSFNINDERITHLFPTLYILKQCSYFYFVNIDNSLNSCPLVATFCISVDNILLEGRLDLSYFGFLP